MSDKKRKKQIAKISVFITSIFIIILSISYAFITSIITGEKQVVINAGVLDLVLEEENNVTLINAYPMYDEVGMIQEDSFDFKLVNKTKNDTNYTLYLEDVTPEFITGKCSDLGEITTSSPKECRKNNYPDDLREEVLNNTFFDEGMSEEDALRLWKEEMATDIYVYQTVETFEDIIDIAIDYEYMVEDTRILIETYPENNYETYTVWFAPYYELKYYLTKDGVGEVRQFPDVYKEDWHLEDVELDYGSIKGNQSIDYSLRLWINSEVDYGDWISKCMFSYKLKVEVGQEIEKLTLWQTLDLENKVDTTTEIDFSEISSETNGRGIYKYTEDGEDIYYWRGAVTDNHIIFGGYCWEMIRTTKTGGVKMIYDGEPVDGKCTNTGDESSIGKSYYNDGRRRKFSYILGGYMYGLQESDSSYPLCLKLNESKDNAEVGEETTESDCSLNGGKWVTSDDEIGYVNVVNSDVKNYIDNWFKTSTLNINFNLKKIEDTVYCNEKKYNGSSYFEAHDRTRNNESPILECENFYGRYTVGTENGNGDLTYPIGLITADELRLAGAVYDTENDNFYLNTGNEYLTITPDGSYESYGIAIFIADDTGKIDAVLSGLAQLNVRPVISLKSGVKVTDGDGTEESPYIVE